MKEHQKESALYLCDPSKNVTCQKEHLPVTVRTYDKSGICESRRRWQSDYRLQEPNGGFEQYPPERKWNCIPRGLTLPECHR